MNESYTRQLMFDFWYFVEEEEEYDRRNKA